MRIPLGNKKKAVSPVIATTLLIAIAVLTAIVLYTFVVSLENQVSQTPVNQVTSQLQLDAYNFQPTTTLTFYLRNPNPSTVTVTAIYLDGIPAGSVGTVSWPPPGSIAAQTTQAVTISGLTAANYPDGSIHQITVVTSTGAQSFFDVIAGESG